MSGICSPTSFFNQRLPGDRPIDPNSATYIASLVAQVESTGANFEFRDWSLPCWFAGPETPTQKVWLDVADGTNANMRKALEAVPIPSEMRPPGPWPTGDHVLAIYQPSTDKYWEMHGARQFEVDGPKTGVAGCTTLEEPGWHCDNAAAVANFSQSPGYFRDNDWPGITGQHWGVSGSGIFTWPGVIKIAEAQRLHIPHPIRLELPTTQKSFRWPAQKSDGKSEDPTMPQEGMLLALPEGYDLSKVKDSFAKAVCRAGFIITDHAGNVSIKCETQATKRGLQSYTTDAWKGAEDKFGSPGAIFQKTPQELAAEIPWADYQVVDASYRPSSIAPGMLPVGV